MKSAMSKRVIALVMVASLSSTTLVEAAEIKKDESVFVNLSTTGEPEKTTVSNWIHADNSNLTIQDKTDLKDVKNVKGETEPNKSGQNLTWKMDGSDLYYQGTTDKELPIGVNVKYYLNDREMEPEDLSGKSGKVRIEISVENKSYKDVEINGKQRKIYTPFTTATVVTLPVDKFSNVTTDGGNMLSEGNNNIVSFVAAPGLMESLGVDSLGIDFKLKDKMTIEADVENFSLGPVMVTASPNLVNLDDLDDVDENTTVSELKDKLDKLKDGMEQLVDGTGQLKSGIDSAKPKMEALLSEMRSASMQEKMSLITDNNKVNGARTLINDAFYAKGVDSSTARDALGKLDSIDINEVKGSLNKANTLAEDAKVFAKKQSTINLLYNTMNDLNKDENFKVLMNSVESIDLDAVNEKYNASITKLQPILQVATPENLAMAQTLLKDVKAAEPYATKVQKVIATAIQNTPGNSVDEKTANFIKGLNDSLNVLNQLGTIDVKSMSAALTSMPQDITNYSEAYLTLKGYLGYALKTGTLDTEKQKLVTIISGVYASKPEVKNELVNYINSFDASKFTEAALKQDEVKLNTYKALMPQVNEIATMLPKVTPMISLASQIAPSEEEIETIQTLLTEVNKNKQTISEVSDLLKNTNPNDIVEIQKMMAEVNSYITLLNKNKDNINKIKGAAAVLNDKELMGGVDKFKGDLDSLDALNLASTLQGKLSGINIDDSKIAQIKEVSSKLLDMQNDLKNNEDILRITQDALSEGNVERARNLINSLPESEGKIKELIDGIGKLDEGANKYKTKGIDVLYDKGKEATNSIDEISLAKDEVVKASEEYGSFSGKADDMTGTTKFIMKTAEIEEAEPEETEVKEVKTEKKGFFAWLKSLFFH